MLEFLFALIVAAWMGITPAPTLIDGTEAAQACFAAGKNVVALYEGTSVNDYTFTMWCVTPPEAK